MATLEAASFTNEAPVETPRDLHLREQLEQEAHFAAEQVTFHSVERERYERIGRAAVRALEALSQHEPIGERTPSDWATADAATKVAASNIV